MVIKEAIQLAEQYAKEYPTSCPWHIVDAPHELSVVMYTYFNEHPEAESLYNTTDKMYHGKHYDEFFPLEDYIMVIYDCSGIYLDEPQVYSTNVRTPEEAEAIAKEQLDVVEIESYDIIVIKQKDTQIL